MHYESYLVAQGVIGCHSTNCLDGIERGTQVFTMHFVVFHNIYQLTLQLCQVECDQIYLMAHLSFLTHTPVSPGLASLVGWFHQVLAGLANQVRAEKSPHMPP